MVWFWTIGTDISRLRDMKLTSNEINTLLQELYASDPSLREREKDLIKIIQRIADAKPNVSIDKKFLQSLRTELLGNSKTLSTPMKLNDTLKPKKPVSRMWPALSLAFSGVAVAAMAALFVMQDSMFTNSDRRGPSNIQPVAFNALSINRVSRTAFGTLNIAESSVGKATGMGGGGGDASAAYATRSASPEVAPVPSVEPSAQSTVAVDAPTVDSKMIMPYEPTITEYIYKGDELRLDETSMDVYKRVNGSFSAGSLASMVQGLNLGVVDLSTFPNADIGDISIYQNQPFGYQIYISPRNGTMSIDQNWEQWRTAYPSCQDENCWKASQIKESDIPADSELIALADAFLAEHRIDRSAYAAGEVDHSWKQYYLPEGETRYVPDTLTVVYPLVLDGQTAYINGGMKMGINVMVNLRVKKVSGIYNLQSLNMDASTYDAETDVSKILSSAKNGGLSSPIRYMDATTLSQSKKVEAELGTPTTGLVQIYQYKDNQSVELYAPALFFPVIKKPQGMEWSASNVVIVPLVKGFEDEMNPTPFSMGRGGAEVSSSGGVSAVGVEVAPAPPANVKAE